jgi:hypothetical protein
MFSYSTVYYVSPPIDQYLKNTNTFKNRCSLLYIPYFADTYSRTVHPIDLHNF